MPSSVDPTPLRILEKLAALAQNGLAYSPNEYDRERYEQLRALTADLLVSLSPEGPALEPVKQAFARLFPKEVGYRTPKLDVRAIVFKDEKVLLVHERSDDRWSVPGGWADVGESPAGNVIKEVKEESGYDAKVVRLLALLDRANHTHGPVPWYSYKAFFLCEISGSAISDTLETQGVDFFALDSLPPISTERVTPTQLKRFYAMYKDGEQAAWFD